MTNETLPDDISTNNSGFEKTGRRLFTYDERTAILKSTGGVTYFTYLEAFTWH